MCILGLVCQTIQISVANEHMELSFYQVANEIDTKRKDEIYYSDVLKLKLSQKHVASAK